MATVLFVEASGAEHRIDVPAGENLMRAALNEGLDGMVGECGGGLACATCHCYVEEDWADRLPAPAQTELGGMETTPEVDVAAVVQRAVEETLKLTIDIPRIAVVPRGEVTNGFHPFTLDVTGLHLQPKDRSLVGQTLRTHEQFT